MGLNNWMSDIKDDVKLNQLVFPATHDSGMSWETAMWQNLNPLRYVATAIIGLASVIDDLQDGRKPTAFHNNYVTQLERVGGQLSHGARQFDLRMTKHGGYYRAYHGHVALGIAGQRRYGEYWDSICDAIGAFMAANPREFLILKMDKQDSDEFPLMRKLSDSLTQHGYVYAGGALSNKLYLEHSTLGSVRGRVFVCSKEKLVTKWKAKGVLHPAITYCVWDKVESVAKIKTLPNHGTIQRVGGQPPIYRLVGSAEGTEDAKENVLKKQHSMAKVFFDTDQKRPRVGMRGIWFNTYSFLRDIRRYSEEIWADQMRGERDNLWLNGKNRQNVASVDFLDEDKGKYIVGKNAAENWVNNAVPGYLD